MDDDDYKIRREALTLAVAAHRGVIPHAHIIVTLADDFEGYLRDGSTPRED